MGNNSDKTNNNKKNINKKEPKTLITPTDEIDLTIHESNINIPSSNEKAIVGIDFGTSGIGYAYSLINNNEQIFISDFEGQSADKKVPSEIILDTNMKDVLAFGAECKKYILTHKKKKNL